MKLELYTPDISLSVDLTTEPVTEILGIALNYATGVTNESPVSPVIEDIPKPTNVPAPPRKVTPTPTYHPPALPSRVTEAFKSRQQKYKGFLYITCDSCGNTKGFCSKQDLTFFKCDCGAKTTLTDLKVMRVKCECGKEFKYLTNSKEHIIINFSCLGCGSPIDLEFHEKRQEYVTIGKE